MSKKSESSEEEEEEEEDDDDEEEEGVGEFGVRALYGNRFRLSGVYGAYIMGTSRRGWMLEGETFDDDDESPEEEEEEEEEGISGSRNGVGLRWLQYSGGDVRV